MRKIVLFYLLFCVLQPVDAQKRYSDSLKNALAAEKEISNQVNTMGLLSSYYESLFPDSALYYSNKMIDLSARNNYKYGEALGKYFEISAIEKQGDFTTAIQKAYKLLNLSRELDEHRLFMLSRSYRLIGSIHTVSGNAPQGISFLHKSLELQKKSGELRADDYDAYLSLAFSMLISDKKDSALYYQKKGFELYTDSKDDRNITPWIVSGNVTRMLGNIEKAEEYFRTGISKAMEFNAIFFVAAMSNDLGWLFFEKGMRDSCIHYFQQSLHLSTQYKYKVFEMSSSGALSDIYDPINKDSTLKYLKIYIAARDEVFSEEKLKQYQAAGYDEEKRNAELINAKAQYENRLKMYGVIGAAAIFLILSFILFRNNRQKQKANHLLAAQKGQIESTLSVLKSTQAQLIQSEKMASLGELTAGIAHEIQNPLNFVNNFSEINNELVDEMKADLATGNLQEAIQIADDIKDNGQKINEHGKRADAIVKAMLLHSRASTGHKEQTDINALAAEYLRLAYHGMRSKEKDFDCIMNTDFDKTIGKMDIVAQDLGRVLLNLYNNAFYAVKEKQQLSDHSTSGNYEPAVSVSTKKTGDKIVISVRDNGNGIQPNIIDKIFQPFFTTKQGQGTGLGLSLSYDIVKAHGGEILVKSSPGEFSLFTITLNG